MIPDPLNIHSADDVTAREVWRGAQSVGITSGHFFQTSGSTGGPKWVHLSQAAIEASARAVNEKLGCDSNDVWGLALPTHHVGGAMIGERARLSGSGVKRFEGKWDAGGFVEFVERKGVTLTSLVPTQLHDLVQAGMKAPDSLRAVIVGGGALDGNLEQPARELAWPVYVTYGMTETASQVALGREELEILPHFECRVEESGRLWLKGKALFSSYLSQDEDGRWQKECPIDSDGWFRTNDRAELASGSLRISGRSDDVVKVLGELVDIAAIERATGLIVIALPDDRKGHRLVACGEDAVLLETAVEQWNSGCQGYERLEGQVVDIIPRSLLGKVQRGKLSDYLKTGTDRK